MRTSRPGSSAPRKHKPYKRGRSHATTIIDEFTDLPVSRQRKAQLRRQRDGKCRICGSKAASPGFCKKHISIVRERVRKRLGTKRRYRSKWQPRNKGMKPHWPLARKRIKMGLCFLCGKKRNASRSTLFCNRHLESASGHRTRFAA